MILETLFSTAITEFIRSKLPKRPHVNNISEIKHMEKQSTITVETVGELRCILEYFADDVRLIGGFNYPTIQLYQLDGVGVISIGSASYKSPYVRKKDG